MCTITYSIDVGAQPMRYRKPFNWETIARPNEERTPSPTVAFRRSRSAAAQEHGPLLDTTEATQVENPDLNVTRDATAKSKAFDMVLI